MEFSDAESLRRALLLHHAELSGRRINCELTAGGGGAKSARRRGRIAEKNAQLSKERAHRAARSASEEQTQGADNGNADGEGGGAVAEEGSGAAGAGDEDEQREEEGGGRRKRRRRTARADDGEARGAVKVGAGQRARAQR